MKLHMHPTTTLGRSLAAILICIVAPVAIAQDVQKQQNSTDTPRSVAERDRPVCPRPVYPAESKQKNQEGDATIEFYLAANGFIVAARVLKSSGHPLLDQASLIAVVSCRGQASNPEAEQSLLRSKVTYRWRLND